MEQKVQQTAKEFLKRIQEKLPTEKADKPSIIGIVGMIGSGRTLLAKTLIENVKGAVLISANSARWLLKENNLGWGENVYEILLYVAEWLVKNGYIVVYDGNQVDKNRREAIKELADKLSAKYHLLKIITSAATAEKYLREKYTETPHNTFEDYWPGTGVDDIVQNLHERNKDFFAIDQEIPKPEFFDEIENEGTIEEFKQKIVDLAEKIK
ncbi:MAG: AAA family ATPase [Candidatus Paceibacterota bacterium]|jgi:predicted kinase|nr:AAA family ATPase [Candidatus Portnoybacteria bacterium]MDD5752126.1 AAA family ATPase [Candidatus Portnoybacteria bacterium]HNU96916.1 AAA family ATPase [Candidatus Portnoybacteria bacterium]HOZ16588.1 AAA family ATPase [Candidatus Portnoybacteria bacterium]HPH52322.1 AAA family ATPase [Candidatus Portnoybacteria bacterium]